MSWRARRAVLAPAVVLFTILIAHALLETARDALFLTRLGPQLLAAAYLVMAACALLAVLAVRRWGHMRDPRRMLIAFLVLAVAGTSVLAFAIALSTTMIFALYIWTGFIATLVVPCFWTAIDRGLQIGEAKRRFGFIGAGGVLGAMVGSAIASGLARVVATRHLVTAGAAAFAVATVVAALLLPRQTASEPPIRQRHAEALSRGSRHYIHLLLGFALLATIVLTLGDLTFKRVMAQRLAGQDLARVLGEIYAGLNAIALVIQVFLTSRLVRRWGVGAALALLPLILVASSIGFALTGATAAIFLLKLGDGGLRHSLYRIGSEILYLPIPAAVRDRWKVIADAIGQRGGQALAALVGFALAAAHGGLRSAAIAIAGGGILWLAALTIVRRGYVSQFRDMLQAGDIQREVALPGLDADALALLAESLSSPDELEALAALDMLARGGRIPAFVFYHPRPAVVHRALSLLAGDLRPDVARVLVHLLAHDDPRIRAAALAASIRTQGINPTVIASLDDPVPEIRAVALVALAPDPTRSAHIAGRIAEMAGGSPKEQLALAEAIAFFPDARFRSALHQLLDSGGPDVRRRVLQALARDSDLVEVDRLLPLLADAATRGEARAAFLAAGRHGLDVLIAALDNPATPLTVRRHLPRTISRFRSADAATALAARLPHEPDPRTELKLLRALGRMRANDPALELDHAPVREYLRRAAHDAAHYAVLAEYPMDRASPSGQLIREILIDKRRTTFEHALRALGILHPRAGLRSAYDALASDDDSRRSVARELVDTLAPADVRAALLAVIDDVSPEQRRERLGELAPGPFRTEQAYIATLLDDASQSLRCVVASYVAERHLVALRGELERLRRPEAPPFVTLAFDQAIARLDA